MLVEQAPIHVSIALEVAGANHDSVIGKELAVCAGIVQVLGIHAHNITVFILDQHRCTVLEEILGAAVLAMVLHVLHEVLDVVALVPVELDVGRPSLHIVQHAGVLAVLANVVYHGKRILSDVAEIHRGFSVAVQVVENEYLGVLLLAAVLI